MRIFLTTIAILALFASLTQAQNYNDVLVVVNSNSQLSVDVGNYFVTARSIPSVNKCSIAMPTTEEITGAQYTTIYNAIKSYIAGNGLTGINYIVTTQGVPLKVRRNLSPLPASGYTDASSFDSDLTVMNSSREQYMGSAGYVSNPYYGASAAFSRASYMNIYLVTRLAGYTYSDIVALIQNANSPYVSSGTFVFDRDPTKQGYSIDQRMVNAHAVAQSKGFNSVLNSDQIYLTNYNYVLGYVSWGSNDAYWPYYSWKARSFHSYSPKALAEQYVSTSGRSFQDSAFVEPTVGWQSLVADMIGTNGVTGVKGYVFEPFTFAMANVETLFDRWLNGKTLAESYYAASYTLSWMDVVIGDPKSTFGGSGHLPVELTTFTGRFFKRYVRLDWSTATEVNNLGFEVQKQIGTEWTVLGFVDGHGTTSAPQYYSFTDNNPLSVNTYRLKQIDRDGRYEYSSIVNVAGKTEKGFNLNQNHPNPFNPSTSITYTLPVDAAVTVQIYTVDGRLIKTLLQGAENSHGTNTLFWDGSDIHGVDVPSGTYFYRMSASVNGEVQFSAVKQMALAR